MVLRRWTLSRRLLLSVLLPSLLAGVLLAGHAHHQWERAVLAEQVGTDLTQAVALGRVVATLDGEGRMAYAMASLRPTGLDRGLIDRLANLDLDDEQAQLRRRTNDALAQVDLAALPAELAADVAELAGIRTRIDSGGLRPASASAYYNDLALLAQRETERLLTTSAAHAARLGADDLIGDIEIIGELNQLSRLSTEWIGQAYLAAFLPTPTSSGILAGGTVELTRTLDRLADRYPSLTAEPGFVDVATDTSREEYLSDLLDRTPAGLANPAAFVEQVAPEQWDAVETLDQISTSVADRVAGDLIGIAGQARNSALATAVGTGLITLSLSAAAAWSLRAINRAVKDLETRAKRISAGALEFQTPEAGQRAPSELMVVHDSLDELVRTLVTLEDQARQLAEGNLDSPLLHRPAGALSQILAGSIKRLRSTTIALRESEQMAHAVIETASEAVVIVDDDGIVIQANEAARRDTGVALLGSDLADVLPDWRVVDGSDHEIPVEAEGGRTRLVLASGSRIITAEEILTIILWRDITQRKIDEEALRHQAQHDILTGLLNRHGLKAALAESRWAESPVCLILLDLDRFKPLNDANGHEAGDHALVEVARRLLRATREDDLVARLGGDEFIVVIPADSTRVTHLGPRLAEVIELPIDLPSGAQGNVGVSIGWAEGSDLPVDELLRRADVALYEAKESEDVVVAYDRRLSEIDEDRRRTATELGDAVARDELVLFGQPIVDVKTGETHAIETLVRWQHPTRGLLLPGQFIPIAERSDLVLEVDRWVFAKAFRMLAEDPDLPMLSVNVSGRFLARDGDLIEYVDALLDEYEVEPHRLQIEVTETHAAIGTLIAASSASALRARGLSIALDDFGTGYSSLTHLLQMPVTSLKIDRSMVQTMHTFEACNIVSAVVDYGRRQGLEVVAEGVETEEQRDALIALGCPLAQGHLFAKPKPFPDLRHRLVDVDRLAKTS